MFRIGVLRCAAATVVAPLLVAVAPIGQAQTTPSMPAFTPYPSAWSPNYTVFPYNLWRSRVTPEQVVALRDS